ncbi:Histone-lysine N-methyltransferase SETMAR like protein [Argiope bruennichi]|uniref:Histone-lysine N-methyltransferase SETMAR like protein n=1 Tax=Argiope bruennichi TaxID=94029 RepID=A0A8T0FIR7_ARGBR|nr:Histone-lysine N-methyltransferase SETMAR like protein [Argiope bruennichi]
MTIDETWIHHYTPDSKRSSAEWTAADESGPKRPKIQKSAGKIITSVFWDAHGIFFIDYLEKGKTIKSEYYMALLDRFSAEIKDKRPHVQKKEKFCFNRTMSCVTNR